MIWTGSVGLYHKQSGYACIEQGLPKTRPFPSRTQHSTLASHTKSEDVHLPVVSELGIPVS